MKDLRTRALSIVLIVLLTSQVTLLASVFWQERVTAQTRVGELVETSARVVGSAYVSRRLQAAQTTTQMAVNEAVLELSIDGEQAQLEQLLRSRFVQDEGEFLAIVTENQSILAFVANNDDEERFRPVTTALNTWDLVEGPVLKSFGKQTIALNVHHFTHRRKSFWAIAGFDPAVSINTQLAKLSAQGIEATLLEVGKPSAEVTAEYVVLPLDSGTDGDLRVGLDFSASSVQPSLWRSVKNHIVHSVVTLSLGLLLASLLIRHWLRHAIEKPLADVRRVIRTLAKGDFEESIDTTTTAPFNQITHDLEFMRESVLDRETRIMHHAEYDALTGLTNRSVIAEKLKLALGRAERSGTVVTALAIDLARFSEINGSMGHDVGDAVLKEIARRLASNARVTDTVARVGGDEFFIILEDLDFKLAQHLAKFMVSSLMTPINVNGTELKLNIHSGVAFYPQHCDNAEALRRMANIALYTGKEHNTTFVIYEAGQDEKHLRELAIIHDLPNAIKNNELYLQYQPKIDMETQQVKQVEALVRWRHPQLGFIPPDEFIALLEKAGMIGRLTDWVFKEAIKQTRAWVDAGFNLGVAVNISANDLADEKIAERIKLLLHHYLVDASSITIEVTESAVIKDPENSVKVLNEIRHAGIKISLDDFGTGQTSLALLKQLPIGEIKIDKSFVQNLRADSGDAIIVKSIIDLGHNMGLHVTAEGVESNYCWNLLNSYGCNLVQGYLVSAPLTADELGEWHLRLQDRHVNKLDLSFVHDMTA